MEGSKSFMHACSATCMGREKQRAVQKRGKYETMYGMHGADGGSADNLSALWI